MDLKKRKRRKEICWTDGEVGRKRRERKERRLKSKLEEREKRKMNRFR